MTHHEIRIPLAKSKKYELDISTEEIELGKHRLTFWKKLRENSNSAEGHTILLETREIKRIAALLENYTELVAELEWK
jgi:hypothetical protein